MPRRRGWDQGLIWKVEVSTSAGASLFCRTAISVGHGWREELLGTSACACMCTRACCGLTFDSVLCNVKNQSGHQAVWKCYWAGEAGLQPFLEVLPHSAVFLAVPQQGAESISGDPCKEPGRARDSQGNSELRVKAISLEGDSFYLSPSAIPLGGERP